MQTNMNESLWSGAARNLLDSSGMVAMATLLSVHVHFHRAFSSVRARGSFFPFLLTRGKTDSIRTIGHDASQSPVLSLSYNSKLLLKL